jgi:hypothetical protein
MIEVAEKERERERERERTKKTANVNAFLYGSYSHNKISVKHSLKIRPDFAQQLFDEVFVFDRVRSHRFHSENRRKLKKEI